MSPPGETDMLESNALRTHFETVMVEAFNTHNKALVRYHNDTRKRRPRETRWVNQSAYGLWHWQFRQAVQQSIQTSVDTFMNPEANRVISVSERFNRLSQAEFALRAQLAINLLAGATDCGGGIVTDPGDYWKADSYLNGYVIRFLNKDAPADLEFGRFVTGSKSGPFLQYTEKTGWMIANFQLSRSWTPPTEYRKAKSSEVYFDATLNSRAAEITSAVLGDTFKDHHPQWRALCTAW
jgi:hypothetical protein